MSTTKPGKTTPQTNETRNNQRDQGKRWIRQYPLLPGDGAIPDHEIDSAIRESLRPSDETLETENKSSTRQRDPRRGSRSGLLTWGWFFRHALRSSARRPRAMPPDIVLALSLSLSLSASVAKTR